MSYRNASFDIGMWFVLAFALDNQATSIIIKICTVIMMNASAASSSTRAAFVSDSVPVFLYIFHSIQSYNLMFVFICSFFFFISCVFLVVHQCRFKTTLFSGALMIRCYSLRCKNRILNSSFFL